MGVCCPYTYRVFKEPQNQKTPTHYCAGDSWACCFSQQKKKRYFVSFSTVTISSHCCDKTIMHYHFRTTATFLQVHITVIPHFRQRHKSRHAAAFVGMKEPLAGPFTLVLTGYPPPAIWITYNISHIWCMSIGNHKSRPARLLCIQHYWVLDYYTISRILIIVLHRRCPMEHKHVVCSFCGDKIEDGETYIEVRNRSGVVTYHKNLICSSYAYGDVKVVSPHCGFHHFAISTDNAAHMY